ncbi:helix-turn-helix domain-containing protein [Mycobacterium sp. E802]|uniref:winged helix-turn-helix transcriptional regulator n=1 Tax=Mycobacterium sp. E802 TaxID=1834152 RepID=UPI0009EE6806|nr:helix-turn-helix domain-containing protein [Mycobacterium sp. E802]
MRSANGPEFAQRAEDPANAPMLAAMDLLGQRWMMRIVWELEPGPLGFLELRRRMGNCSSSMLSERLQQLSAANVTAKSDTGAWELTFTGHALGAALTPVWDWSESWKPRAE